MALDCVRMVEFQQNGDEHGHLVVVEGENNIPFAIQRVFYIYGTGTGVVRGCHANRRTDFVLINVAGCSQVAVSDGLGNEAVFQLNRQHAGIYVPHMIWKEMFDFSPDSVLLVLASEHYDSKEYIRSYDEYVKEVAHHA
jgi:hypothetical protein